MSRSKLIEMAIEDAMFIEMYRSKVNSIISTLSNN